MNIVLNMEHTYKTLDDRVETIEQVKKKNIWGGQNYDK